MINFQLGELPAAEVLVLLDVVRLEADAVEVVPQLALVALHPVHLNTHRRIGPILVKI